jgi:quercetin dioxygenase-like cupin family protein
MTDMEVSTLVDMVAYQPGSVVSRKILGGKGGNVTLFAFAQGEGLTEHTSPYEALVVVLDGQAEIRVDGVTKRVAAGQTIVLPATVPHALDASEPFKMMLTMIREAKAPSS